MVSDNFDFDSVKEEMERILVEQPHVGSLLNAFGPLLLAKKRWLAEVHDYTRQFSVDPLQYSSGIPLLQQCQLFSPDDPWQSAGQAITEALSRGFPQFAEEMTGLSKQMMGNRLDFFSLVNNGVALEEAQLLDRARDLSLEPIVLQLFLQYLNQFMLTKRAQDVAKDLEPLSWKKGYCPVCGNFPQLAILRENGQKWLQCSACSHEWQFPRLTCPNCEHADPENTTCLFVEGKKGDTAFTCSKCRKYLITSDQSGNIGQTCADLIAIRLAHFDLILQEKGFLPMAEGVGNFVQSPSEE